MVFCIEAASICCMHWEKLCDVMMNWQVPIERNGNWKCNYVENVTSIPENCANVQMCFAIHSSLPHMLTIWFGLWIHLSLSGSLGCLCIGIKFKQSMSMRNRHIFLCGVWVPYGPTLSFSLSLSSVTIYSCFVIVIMHVFNYDGLLFFFVCQYYSANHNGEHMETYCIVGRHKMMCMLTSCLWWDWLTNCQIGGERWQHPTTTTTNNAIVFWIRVLIRSLYTVYPVCFVSISIVIYAANKSNRRTIALACPWQRMLVTPALCQPYGDHKIIIQSYTMVRHPPKVL